MVKNLPAMQETGAQSLGWEDPLEKGTGTHFSILAWKNPMDRGAWQATVHGVTESRPQLSKFLFLSLLENIIFHHLIIKLTYDPCINI